MNAGAANTGGGNGDEVRETVWVCISCGKRSHDQSGKHPINDGWDVSCTVNAALVYADKLEFDEAGTRVVRVLDNGLVPHSLPAKIEDEGAEWVKFSDWEKQE